MSKIIQIKEKECNFEFPKIILKNRKEAKIQANVFKLQSKAQGNGNYGQSIDH